MDWSKLQSLDEALQEALGRARRYDGQPWPMEQVGLFDADGRTLAMDLVSPIDIPSWDNSAMDGYALRTSDLAVPGQLLPIAARIAAGCAPQALPAGAVARIFTGAPIPAGADAVLVQEKAEHVDDGTPFGALRVLEAPKPGASIRRIGEDLSKGEAALRKGERLTPASLGVAASAGASKLWVSARPKVAFFSTGDELAMPGEVAPENLPPGSIFNSTRFFLGALIARAGCVPLDMGIVPDGLEATKQALLAASVVADVVITCGGVGAGDEDHVKSALREVGSLDLWQLAIKPGKPFAMGAIGRACFIGLPGNPVAAMVTFMMLALPFLLRLQGVVDVEPRCFMVPAGFDFHQVESRREFPRASVGADGRLRLYASQGSAVLTSMARGHGLVDLGSAGPIKAGDLVKFIPFGSLM